jgi:hypothetical protein
MSVLQQPVREVVAMFRYIATGITAACGKKERGTCRALIRAIFCLSLLLPATGCAPTLYNINMRYEPTTVIRPAPSDGRKYTLTVASFIDKRKMEDTLLIGRVIKSDGGIIPIVPQYAKPTDALTTALREILFKSGYIVSPDRPAWDLNEATIRPEWGTILISGTIDDIDVTCLDNLTIKRYSAKARVTLVFADVQKKRTFYKITSESRSSLDHIVFSEDKLESQINGVLSDAMEKAIEGPETGRQIREALRQ